MWRKLFKDNKDGPDLRLRQDISFKTPRTSHKYNREDLILKRNTVTLHTEGSSLSHRDVLPSAFNDSDQLFKIEHCPSIKVVTEKKSDNETISNYFDEE